MEVKLAGVRGSIPSEPIEGKHSNIQILIAVSNPKNGFYFHLPTHPSTQEHELTEHQYCLCPSFCSALFNF
jgi:hypothetical protein